MHTMSIDTAQQLVADRRASYEGVAARRRLRKVARKATHVAAQVATHEAPAADLAPAPIAGSGQVETGNTASRKVA